jgi:RNA-directed DNA polymerase
MALIQLGFALEPTKPKLVEFGRFAQRQVPKRRRRMRHLLIEEQVVNLNRVLQAHYAYYGVAGNFRALQRVHRAVQRYWCKTLCSRSRKGHFPWEMFQRIKARFPLQRPRLAFPHRELQSLAVL